MSWLKFNHDNVGTTYSNKSSYQGPLKYWISWNNFVVTNMDNVGPEINVSLWLFNMNNDHNP